MKKTVQNATSLPAAPMDERRVRVIKYSVAMAIRMICIVMMLFAQGWWLLLFAMGAIFLPYFAVIIANASVNAPGNDVARPGALVPLAVSDRNSDTAA